MKIRLSPMFSSTLRQTGLWDFKHRESRITSISPSTLPESAAQSFQRRDRPLTPTSSYQTSIHVKIDWPICIGMDTALYATPCRSRRGGARRAHCRGHSPLILSLFAPISQALPNNGIVLVPRRIIFAMLGLSPTLLLQVFFRQNPLIRRVADEHFLTPPPTTEGSMWLFAFDHCYSIDRAQ